MSLIYWDSMLFIYILEENPAYCDRVRTIFEKMEKRRDKLCTSAFTIGEVLAGPYQAGRQDVVQQIRGMFREPFVRILPFTAETADRYAAARALPGVSPPDAIHLACAAEAGVDLFLTNDLRLKNRILPGIQFIAGLDVNLF